MIFFFQQVELVIAYFSPLYEKKEEEEEEEEQNRLIYQVQPNARLDPVSDTLYNGIPVCPPK